MVWTKDKESRKPPGAGQAGISDSQVSMVENVSEFWLSRRYTCQNGGKDNVFLVGSQREKAS